MHNLQMDLKENINNQLFALVGISTLFVVIIIGILTKVYVKSIGKS
jgi:hypothetical protein